MFFFTSLSLGSLIFWWRTPYVLPYLRALSLQPVPNAVLGSEQTQVGKKRAVHVSKDHRLELNTGLTVSIWVTHTIPGDLLNCPILHVLY